MCDLAVSPILAIPTTLPPGPSSESTLTIPLVNLSILTGLHVQFLSATTVGGGEQWFTSNLVSVNL